jgi:hypothetical protein
MIAAHLHRNVDLARRCLAKIRDIAERGVFAQDPDHVGYALQELSQVLLERTGREEREFEPIPADQIFGLENLLEELDIVDCGSQSMSYGELAKGRKH